MDAPPSPIAFEDQCAQIVAQTELLLADVQNADLTTAVPSCPGWNVGQLLRHLGGGQRWAAAMVTQNATEWLPDNDFRDLSRYANEDIAVVGPWLAESARLLAGALRAAGPDSPVTTGPIGADVAAFYARRFMNETAVHRADATLAVGAPYRLDDTVAMDALDEWMWLGALPMHFEFHPQVRELLAPGRTVHLHATDTAPELGAEWVIDLTGDVITWRRAHEKSAVAIRGPLVELLLTAYRRRPLDAGRVEVLGDGDLAAFWLERVSFE